MCVVCVGAYVHVGCVGAMSICMMLIACCILHLEHCTANKWPPNGSGGLCSWSPGLLPHHPLWRACSQLCIFSCVLDMLWMLEGGHSWMLTTGMTKLFILQLWALCPRGARLPCSAK